MQKKFTQPVILIEPKILIFFRIAPEKRQTFLRNDPKIKTLIFPRAINFCVKKVGLNRVRKEFSHNHFFRLNPKSQMIFLGKIYKIYKKSSKTQKIDSPENKNFSGKKKLGVAR